MGDVKKIISEANTTIRSAERNMFSGKYDEVIESIGTVRKLLDEAKSLEPDNFQIGSIEKKLMKVVKDVERRTGKDLGGGTGTTSESKPTEMPDKPATRETRARSSAPARPAPKPSGGGDKLPYAARKPFDDASRQVKNFYSNMESYKNADRDDLREMHIKRMEDSMKTSKDMLQKAKEEAAKGGVESHPSFAEIEEKFPEMEKLFAEIKGEKATEDAAKAAGAEEVAKDCDTLREEYERLQETFNKADTRYFNDLEPLKKVIEVIKEFEDKELEPLKEKLSAFEAKYGKDLDSIDKKVDELGYINNYYRGSYGWEKLKEGIEKIEKARQELAVEIINKLNDQAGRFADMHDFSRLEAHKTARTFLDMAKQFSPDNPQVVEADSKMDKLIQEDVAAFNKKIDEREWPGNTSGKESKEAMKFFEGSEDWGKRPAGKETREPLGLAIHGDWSVQAKDIHGNPIQYGIPAYIAVAVNTEKNDNVARVYDVTMRNLESADAKPKPPFHSITVGNSWYIRPDKIK